MALHHFASVFHAIAQEPGAEPGTSLSALQVVALFIGLPVAIFLGITVIVLGFSTKSSSPKQSVLTHIE